MMAMVENHRAVHGSRGLTYSTLDAGTPRLGVYLLIAIIALATGFIVGLSVGQARQGAPAEWPSPAPTKPHPRALEP